MKVLIKAGRVVNPNTNLDSVCDILIDNGVISLVDINIDEEADKIIDASGMTIFPGLTDIHCHFRDPGWPEKETIESGCQAAIAGGVTTVVCMANTSPVCDNEDTLNYILSKGKMSPVNLLQNAAVTLGLKGEELTDAKKLISLGACGLSDDGIPIEDPKLMARALKFSEDNDVVLSVHEELPSLLFSQGVNFGKVSSRLGLGGAPSNAESAIVERDIQLQSVYGGRLHIQHASAARTIELVRQAKKRGQKVTCEVTGQHLTLTEDIVLEKGSTARINPPIRTEEDRRALIEGVKDGTIDCVVTDHAPHTTAEKSKPIASAPSGMTGLETSLSITYDTMVRKEGLSVLRLAQVMSTFPASMYGIDKSIESGKKADLCIFAQDEKWIYNKNKSRSVNSPFYNEELTGRIRFTIIGDYIYEA